MIAFYILLGIAIIAAAASFVVVCLIVKGFITHTFTKIDDIDDGEAYM